MGILSSTPQANIISLICEHFHRIFVEIRHLVFTRVFEISQVKMFHVQVKLVLLTALQQNSQTTARMPPRFAGGARGLAAQPPEPAPPLPRAPSKSVKI